ncbi:NUDIX hydrolase [Nocardioides sp.]|uniref:NUDIX hydrolase n=1 Tax=Nocardioides sp. TaxID=35761 RepID=UPI002D80C608|nr:NUDIX hydrolase [Nocardioides sp.]HET8961673.1 NUDIX hydrolase [Nocardioides sp.]
MYGYSSVALIDRRGWVLLQERDEHPVIDPEKWGFPGGGVEDGETYEDAAYRELAEETGVRLDGGLEQFGEFVCNCGECGDTPFVVYAAPVDLTDDDIECHEGRQMVFVEPTRALGLDLTSSARIALPLFLESEAYRRMTP